MFSRLKDAALAKGLAMKDAALSKGVEMKDAALSKSLQVALNNHIKEFGTMLKLNVDSHTKSIELDVMLEGEVEPLKVHVARYELTAEGGSHFVTLHGITTSRAWINTAVSPYLEGKRFAIPAEYARLLKVVV